jgi:NADH-quinone oxidoreductase subunit L
MLENPWLPAIIAIPLLGALLNATLGKSLGKTFVKWVGVGAPLLAFVLSLATFCGILYADNGLPGTSVQAFRGEKALISQVNSELLRGGLAGSRARWEISEEGKGEEKRVLRVRNVTPAQVEELRQVQRRVDTGGRLQFGQASQIAPRTYGSDLGAWISVKDFEIRFNFFVDRLAAVLLLIITGIGSLIHVYSTGYMGHESPGTFARFFTYLNLFVGAMLVLVMGSNLPMMFIGWEGVGLCSYLLIGFGYQDPANAACGTKAFVVNRIGDVGFVLGMFTLLVAMASYDAGLSLEFSALNNTLGAGAPHALLGIACVLLFLGATGKSAQIPLHLWLPDAMAGPTPVSALIHAATMVTAGIYMIARLGPVFFAAEIAGVPVLGGVALVGVATAFFAGCAALGQDDIKRVLAYSTVSQLGYMFVGVGAAAYGAAVFHLVTHAFFKALLFLGAGAVIHATHTQSMREMGGLWKKMPITAWTMLLGALALAGFPPFSGFFSKDLVLFETLIRYNSANSSWLWGLIYFMGVLTGLITAVYSTRMIVMTFFGEYRGKGTPHEAPTAMTFPLVVLAFLAVTGGLLGLPELWTHAPTMLPDGWLGPLFGFVDVAREGIAPQDVDVVHGLELKGLGLGALAAIAGVLLGYIGWGRRRPAEIPWEASTHGGLAKLRKLLEGAWYYDQIVNKRLVQPGTKYLAALLWRRLDETAIDQGMVDGTGRVAVQLSLFARVFQNGRVSRYAAYMVFGAIVLMGSVAIFSIPSVLAFTQRLMGS